jgi:hypothetical protein
MGANDTHLCATYFQRRQHLHAELEGGTVRYTHTVI